MLCGCISFGQGPDKDTTEGLRSALARLRNRTGPSLPQQPTPPASPLPLASTHAQGHAHIADRGAGRCTSYCQESSNNSAVAATKSGEARAAGSGAGASAADGSHHINGLAHHVSTPTSYAEQKLAPPWHAGNHRRQKEAARYSICILHLTPHISYKCTASLSPLKLQDSGCKFVIKSKCEFYVCIFFMGIWFL